MNERMTDGDAQVGYACGLNNSWSRERRLAVLKDWGRARDAEIDKDAEIARLRADNAALLKAGAELLDAITMGLPAFTERDYRARLTALGQATTAPHPGIALLEEHRKEVEEERSRWKAELAHQWSEWRKALIRARNEGRKQVAQWAHGQMKEQGAKVERFAASGEDDGALEDASQRHAAFAAVVRAISAMKEPEE